jgi:spore germination protein KC
MVGELGDEETRGFLYVKNKVKTGVMQLDVLNTPATIEIRHAKSKVTPVLYTDGRTVFSINVDLTVGIGDQSGTTNLTAPESTAALLSTAVTAVKSEIQAAVDKSKELDADVFGFGEYLNRKYPDQWKEMQEKWDELFKNITVNINVNAKADGSGRIDRPLVPEGA